MDTDYYLLVLLEIIVNERALPSGSPRITFIPACIYDMSDGKRQPDWYMMHRSKPIWTTPFFFVLKSYSTANKNYLGRKGNFYLGMVI
jgi:hypothetical protein